MGIVSAISFPFTLRINASEANSTCHHLRRSDVHNKMPTKKKKAATGSKMTPKFQQTSKKTTGLANSMAPMAAPARDSVKRLRMKYRRAVLAPWRDHANQ